jgi:hypothetical protein
MATMPRSQSCCHGKNEILRTIDVSCEPWSPYHAPGAVSAHGLAVMTVEGMLPELKVNQVGRLD